MEKAIENKTPLTGNFIDISSLKEVTADTKLTIGGWIQENNQWVMYRGDEKVTGWFNQDGTWYYLDQSGYMQKWWIKDKGEWYFLNGSGAMETGWLLDHDKWYYLESSGAMKASQWFEVDGKWYYVNDSGELLVNTTTPDGYKVNANGEWV